MSHKLKSVLFALVLLSLSVTACLPTYVNTMRLYGRENGRILHLELSDPEANQGVIYMAKEQPDSIPEYYEGEYHIYGARRFPGQIDKFYNSSIAEEYGFGKQSGAEPVGTAILVGDEGTVIDIVFYKVDNSKKNGSGIARDNHGNTYRVFLKMERHFD